MPIRVEQLYTNSKGAKPKVVPKMKKEFARRLPGVGKWVRALDELQVKYARLKVQRDELRIDLAETKAQYAAGGVDGDRGAARARIPVPADDDFGS